MDVVNPNRLVAARLRQARRGAGLSQDQVVERLNRLGLDWSVGVFRQAERSATAERVRRFDPREIAAFACVFSMPFAAFLEPPAQGEDLALGPADGEGIDAELLLRAITDPPTESLAHKRAALDASDIVHGFVASATGGEQTERAAEMIEGLAEQARDVADLLAAARAGALRRHRSEESDAP